MIFEIIGCVALGLAIISLILNIVLFCKVRKNSLKLKNQIAQSVQKDGVVFCRKCNYKYSATLQKCPNCGTHRM